MGGSSNNKGSSRERWLAVPFSFCSLRCFAVVEQKDDVSLRLVRLQVHGWGAGLMDTCADDDHDQTLSFFRQPKQTKHPTLLVLPIV